MRPTDLVKLTALFEKLGAPHPEEWARSEVADGHNELARFVFLREAWKRVIPDGDTDWVASSRKLARESPREPGAAIGPALDRLLKAGARLEDLSDVVRVMQWALLHALCDVLDDPGPLEPDLGGLRWRLYEIDENDEPVAPIEDLSESVLETDPSGRRMQAR